MASFTGAGDDDAVFLSAIAEAEADGMRRLSQGDSKRQNGEPAESVSSSLPSSHGAGYGDSGYGPGDGGYSDRDREVASKRCRVEPEGEYMAALRGNHSETWQAMSSKPRLEAKPRPEGQVPQKNCPCGGGACLVLTANTEKNPGRQFYRCPLKKEEGQCGFFEWCDGFTNSSQGLSKELGSSYANAEFPCPCGAGPCVKLTAKTEKNMGRQFYRCPLEEVPCGFFEWCDGFTSSSQGPSKEQGGSYANAEFPCPCGAGPCVKLTAKTEKNMGRQFYRCPLNQGEGSCNFFKWCDECVPGSGATAPAPAYGGSAYRERTSMSNVATGQCMDGHWAKDCPSAAQIASPNAYASTTRAGQVGSGTAIICFKCNQVGHWANSCPNQQVNYGSKGAVGHLNRQGANNFAGGLSNASGYGSPATGRDLGGVKNASSGCCFKCGSEGHWSNNCPNASNTRQSSYGGGTYGEAASFGKSRGSGSCYKCGVQGHYANECKADGKVRNMF